ncbi:hypothetical protein GCM10022268_08460 [Sphingomonas cynarae]|uniref:Uncharacterized protein n=1 Tax=Sphingomonas cynarae TaxID=930197 RepID=A0ABP7D886_9SPHN
MLATVAIGTVVVPGIGLAPTFSIVIAEPRTHLVARALEEPALLIVIALWLATITPVAIPIPALIVIGMTIAADILEPASIGGVGTPIVVTLPARIAIVAPVLETLAPAVAAIIGMTPIGRPLRPAVAATIILTVAIEAGATLLIALITIIRPAAAALSALVLPAIAVVIQSAGGGIIACAGIGIVATTAVVVPIAGIAALIAL